jgi:hypothetical protein
VYLAAASESRCLLLIKKFSRSDNLSQHSYSHIAGTGTVVVRIMTIGMTSRWQSTLQMSTRVSCAPGRSRLTPASSMSRFSITPPPSLVPATVAGLTRTLLRKTASSRRRERAMTRLSSALHSFSLSGLIFYAPVASILASGHLYQAPKRTGPAPRPRPRRPARYSSPSNTASSFWRESKVPMSIPTSEAWTSSKTSSHSAPTTATWMSSFNNSTAPGKSATQSFVRATSDHRR